MQKQVWYTFVAKIHEFWQRKTVVPGCSIHKGGSQGVEGRGGGSGG